MTLKQSKVFVKEIKSNSSPIDVYDLTIDNASHTFFANNILVHNTDSIFVKFEAALKAIYGDKYDETDESEKIDKLIELNENCANYINTILIPDMLERHNTSPTESSAKKFNFNLKQELVIRRSVYFNKKKKYATWIVRENGKPIDKINNTGMEVVRSDYSEFTRNMMSDFIDIILRLGTDETKIIVKLSDYKEKYNELLKAGSTVAGIPGSWNRENYANNRLPRNVKAMLIYNTIYGNTFKTMDKGYRFDLIGINLQKFPDDIQKRLLALKDSGKLGNDGSFDCIMIPSGSKLDTEVFEIDYDKMIDFSITKRLKDICNMYNVDVKDTDTYLDW